MSEQEYYQAKVFNAAIMSIDWMQWSAVAATWMAGMTCIFYGIYDTGAYLMILSMTIFLAVLVTELINNSAEYLEVIDDASSVLRYNLAIAAEIKHTGWTAEEPKIHTYVSRRVVVARNWNDANSIEEMGIGVEFVCYEN